MEFLAFSLLILIYFIIETIYKDYFKYKKDHVRVVNQIEDFLEGKRLQIKTLSDNLAQGFKCSLCGSLKLDSNVISISGKEYSQISKKRPHKFLKSTCMGCGTTEFFNLNQLWGPDGLDPLPIDIPIYQRFMNMAESFSCRHCRGNSAVAKMVTVRKKGFRHMLIPQSSELVSLCCKICGWTKFFDISVLKKEEKIHARA